MLRFELLEMSYWSILVARKPLDLDLFRRHSYHLCAISGGQWPFC
jgi:hypothetical protein